MMRGKILLTLAISLDGYIADLDGSYGWITGQGDRRLDTKNDFPFTDFLAGIDVIVMGNNSYQQGLADEYTRKKIFVATHSEQKDTENIHFINGDIVSIVLKERDAGKNIYLYGGGVLLDAFIKADVIDEYYIGIIPIILGKGRPLFLGNNPTIPLHLDAYSVQDGIVEIHYSRRKQS